jgi:hypothetical protein
MKLAVVCKLRFVPLRWHNFANELAQLCQRIGTTVPPQWHKSILANAESFRCILADPAYASFIINFLIDDFKLQWNIL